MDVNPEAYVQNGGLNVDEFVKEDQYQHAIINQVIYEGLGQRATSPLEDESSSSFEDPDLPRRALFPE